MKNNYIISTDKKLLDSKKTTELLRKCFWAKNTSQQRVEKLINNSLCFGVFKKNNLEQVGFGRVITDFVSYAYICDVVIDPIHRRQGLGTLLINKIFKLNKLKNVETWSLRATNDSKKIYQQLGFKTLDNSIIRLELNKSVAPKNLNKEH